jgi:hypothetical protein
MIPNYCKIIWDFFYILLYILKFFKMIIINPAEFYAERIF